MSSAIVLTNRKTIDSLSGTAKQMKKPILYALKQKKMNHAHIYSDTPIAIAITR